MSDANQVNDLLNIVARLSMDMDCTIGPQHWVAYLTTVTVKGCAGPVMVRINVRRGNNARSSALRGCGDMLASCPRGSSGVNAA